MDNRIDYSKAGLGWKLLSFFIPILGIILFFVWRKERPKAAKGVLIAGILSLLLYGGGGGGLIANAAETVDLAAVPAPAAIVQLI